MESVFLRLQEIVNKYTSYRLKKAVNLFGLKTEYWDKETLNTHIREEIYSSSCKLIDLHEKYPILHIITKYPDLDNVLWDSTFIESMTSDEKRKYRQSENLTLSVDDLKQDNTVYDLQLPYFSGILSALYLIRYISFLQSQLSKERAKTDAEAKPFSESAAEQEPVIVEKSTFEATFTPEQIELLTNCLNDAHVFLGKIIPETLENILSCRLTQPLKTRNNRLLAYFFCELDNRSLITRNWQSVIDKNKLFLSSGKGNALTKSDLSTANAEIKFKSPKDSEIIDNYLKELKKH